MQKINIKLKLADNDFDMLKTIIPNLEEVLRENCQGALNKMVTSVRNKLASNANESIIDLNSRRA